ncbi:MAG: hypothetical protein KC613_27205, partial [Myxococcales bacterium]|nr:hypothetical protein [Myxococcales bacterium]
GPLGRPVLRDVDGRPYVPGSALRGALRHGLEALLRGLDEPAKGLWATDPEDPAHSQTPTARLFGTAEAPGLVRLGDAWLLDRQGPAPIELREALRLDPATGSAAADGAQVFEVVPPGASFALELFADNLDDWELGLLLCGFDQLAEGFLTLGGLTARGLGRVALRWTAAVDFEPRELLYTGGRIPDAAARDPEGRMAAWRAALAAKLEG